VTEAVQGYGSAGVLKVSHLGPEFWIGRRGLELWIAICGDDGQNGLEAEALNELAQALP
jgi:hypothetical protein